MNALIEKFSFELQKTGGLFSLLPPEQLGNALLKTLSEEDRIIVSVEVNEQYGLEKIWEQYAIPASLTVFDPNRTEKKRWINFVSRATVSITTPLALIAFTGTVVTSSRHDRSRLISVLPERHLVIGERNLLIKDMAEFWEKYGERSEQFGSNLIFITGPSRTADIEKMLVKGAHGPRVFELILLDT